MLAPVIAGGKELLGADQFALAFCEKLTQLGWMLSKPQAGCRCLGAAMFKREN